MTRLSLLESLLTSLPKCRCGKTATWDERGFVPLLKCDAHVTADTQLRVPLEYATEVRMLEGAG